MTAETFTRYAIYWTPAPGPLARFGADWLGWDAACGMTAAQPAIDGLPVKKITAAPRKYGFHATMKAPFRLAAGMTREDVRAALDALAATLPAIRLDALVQGRIGDFLCLRPEGGTRELDALAARTVRGLDAFRAPPTEAEIARRRHSPLTPEADALMLRWGYPHVMERFRFHVTLTGPLDAEMARRAEVALAPLLAPLLPRPFPIDALTLTGEDSAGRFHVLHRASLTGAPAP